MEKHMRSWHARMLKLNFNLKWREIQENKEKPVMMMRGDECGKAGKAQQWGATVKWD